LERNEFFKRTDRHNAEVKEGMVWLVGLPKRPKLIGRRESPGGRKLISQGIEEVIVKLVELPKNPKVVGGKFFKKVEDIMSLEK